MFGLWFSICGLLFGSLCSVKAKEKNRHTKNWFLLGFIFGVLAYAVLSILPGEDKSEYSVHYKTADV